MIDEDGIDVEVTAGVSSVVAKQKERDEIARMTEEFLKKRGKKIIEVPSGLPINSACKGYNPGNGKGKKPQPPTPSFGKGRK